MPIRIAMLLNRYLPIIGGREKQISHLIRQLMTKNYNVTVITRRLNHDLATEESIDGVVVKRLQPVGLNHRANIVMVFRLFVFLVVHRRKYDIFHANSVGPIAIATIFAGKLSRTPVVLLIPTAGDIARSQATPLSLFTRILRRFALPQWLWIWILSQASAIVCLSSEIITETKTYNLDRLAHQIPNGVDLTAFQQTENTKNNLRQVLQIPTDQFPIVFYAGRLVQRKRIDVLIDAFEKVRQIYPSAHLLIAGTGDLQSDSVEEMLKHQVEQLQLKNNVTFLGVINNVPHYLMASDIFAFPSSQEGLPNVVLEAMASGIPIVACPIGGITDILDDESAYLVPVGDSEAFANALQHIIEYPDEAEQKAKRAQKRVEEQFSMEAVATQYEHLYQSLLK